MFAQIPGMTSTQISSSSDGTALGSNETLAYSGIALGNAVKLRGYVDFVYANINDASVESDFSTASDIDFLFDMSPVTSELHLNLTDTGGVGLEQAYGRYSFNQNLHLTFGRQLTPLGFDADEAPGLYAVTTAYTLGGYTGNYVDGVRINFNNGQFGLVAGLHDGYWSGNDNFDGGAALDLAASVMIMPGLEARIGYAYENIDATSDDISQFNTFITYNTGGLTLALEYDYYDLHEGRDLMDMMALVNYSFTDWFAATLRYTYEDDDAGSDDDLDAHRFTLALLFTVTDNLFFNTEYSHTSKDSSDDNEFYVEGLLTF